MLTRQDILEAHERIEGLINKTPVLTSSILNAMCDANLYFKCENFQKVGAFKARGAFNFALQLSKDEIGAGLCTHSSGNHAQAVALAAKNLGGKAYIVMPSNAPKVKVDAVREYGAEVTMCEPTLAARESTLEEIQKKTGAVFMPPYNHERIIAGAATSCKELLEEIDDIEIVVCPVGGGGLLAGTNLSAEYFGDGVTVYAGEPEGADDAKRSFDSGELIPSVKPNTIADGLLTSLGEINFAIIKEKVTDILLVNDKEITAAMRLIWERMKIITEPSAAVTLAVILKYPDLFAKRRVGVILSGGNVDLSRRYF